MAARTALRAPTSARILLQVAAERGISERDCLSGTGLSAEELTEQGKLVTGDQELAIIANLLEALGDPPGLGIEVGIRYHATAHGIWGYALIASPSLRNAIEVGLRYLDLSYSFCRITAHETGDEVRLVIEPEVAEPSIRRFVAERDIGIIQTLHRDVAGPVSGLKRVRLPYPEPAPDVSDRLSAILALAPEFDARAYEAVFEGRTIDDPLPQADRYTAAIAEQQCHELVERRQKSIGVSGQVRSLLLARRHRPLTESQVARILHLSPRTLRRRLTEEDASYRKLLDEVRAQRAGELLTETELSIAEIAERLGFAECASFTRAFRRWTGSSPLRHRRSAERKR